MNNIATITLSAIAGVAIVLAGYASAPDRSQVMRYDEVKLRTPAMTTGEIGEVCIKGEWTVDPNDITEGLVREDTICSDGKPLPINYYVINKPKTGEPRKIDKCANGGKPRDFEFRCKKPGAFVVYGRVKFERRTWWGLDYVVKQDAYAIRGQVLPP